MADGCEGGGGAGRGGWVGQADGGANGCDGRGGAAKTSLPVPVGAAVPVSLVGSDATPRHYKNPLVFNCS